MDTVPHLGVLHNTYFALRHGTSLANEQKIIVSHPDQGVLGYGLSEFGKQQVRDSIQHAMQTGALAAPVIFVSSDFARAKETAEIAVQELGMSTETIELTPKLRERYFGSYDGKSNQHYQDVWAKDVHDAAHKEEGVESVEEVLARTVSVVEDLETKHEGEVIVLVAHGDTLQILQTAFDAVHPSSHRTLVSLQPAELRKLN